MLSKLISRSQEEIISPLLLKLETQYYQAVINVRIGFRKPGYLTTVSSFGTVTSMNGGGFTSNGSLPGGYSQVDISNRSLDSSSYVAALDALNQMLIFNNMFTGVPTNLVDAYSQVVAGLNYILYFTDSQNNQYVGKVYIPLGNDQPTVQILLNNGKNTNTYTQVQLNQPSSNQSVSGGYSYISVGALMANSGYLNAISALKAQLFSLKINVSLPDTVLQVFLK